MASSEARSHSTLSLVNTVDFRLHLHPRGANCCVNVYGNPLFSEKSWLRGDNGDKTFSRAFYEMQTGFILNRPDGVFAHFSLISFVVKSLFLTTMWKFVHARDNPSFLNAFSRPLFRNFCIFLLLHLFSIFALSQKDSNK